MNLLKTSIGITKTIKNVSRFREILSVFARHGFDELIINSKLHLYIPNFVIPKSRFKNKSDDLSDYDFWKSVGFRLRSAFEELGPSFIKVGQLLSTREDILDAALIQELKLLQDRAKAIEFSAAKKVIIDNLDVNIDDVYEYINEEPIGVASIGVVYKARLKSGEDVVIKVRRPNISETIVNDFEIISFIVNKIEKVSEEFRYLGVSRAINDFFKSIQLELNFLFEANNNRKLKNNISKIDTENIFKIPNVYKEYSSEKILVMEFLDGTPFNEIENIEDYPVLKEKLLKGIKLFLHTMLTDGFFHADLHGGNFFNLKNDQIGLIDFGLVGVLSKKNRSNLVAILFAILTNNYENLVFEFLDVADYDGIPDHEVLVRDLRDALMPFIGMSVQEIDATALTHSLVSTLSKHQIYLPREWFIIFRAIMTLDGVGKSLDIDLNIFEIIDSEIQGIMAQLVSKESMMEEVAWLGRDSINSLRIIPRHIRWMLKEFSKRKYTVEVNLSGMNKEVSSLTKSVYFFALILLCSTFFISGAMMAKDVSIVTVNDIPLLTSVCWALSFVTLVRASFIFKLK
jgi:ubiquinone biosynthesis protein